MASSAYDGCIGISPAVNAGSKDWLNNTVYLDDYVLNDRESIYTKALKLTTNRENRTEIYGSYLQYYGEDSKIIIQQLGP